MCNQNNTLNYNNLQLGYWSKLVRTDISPIGNINVQYKFMFNRKFVLEF